MKTLFVCLANSKKYGERCIAGIELKRENDGSLSLVKENSKPKWLRPVSSAEHGEVAAHIVNHIKLNDIVEIDVLEYCPKGYQSENVLFDVNSLKVVGNIALSATNLDKFTVSQNTLFGNKGKAVPEDKISEISNSLLLIKVYKTSIYLRTDFDKNQLRMKFEYNWNEYDLPITDLDFIEKYNKDKNILNNAKNIYLTISLGVVYEGWYYKLVAGVIAV
jgi:hypothetical protein